MMINSLDWESIKSPAKEYSLLKVPGKHPHSISIGKNIDEQYLIVFQLQGVHLELFKKHRVSVLGLHIDLRQDTESDSQHLVITLEKIIDKDIFNSLCLSLINSIQNIDAPDVAIVVILTHLKRWKSFLKGKKRKQLSAEEIKGLFAELHFLRMLLVEYPRQQSLILEAWVGPTGGQQDFIFANSAVEIKAISGKAKFTVRISSEHQLDSVLDYLLLKIFRVGEVEEGIDAKSLNDIVLAIEHTLDSVQLLQQFQSKLVNAGYLPIACYDEPYFQVYAENTYCVAEDFPRLTKGNLPVGIEKVSYELELREIEQFQIDNRSCLEL